MSRDIQPEVYYTWRTGSGTNNNREYYQANENGPYRFRYSNDPPTWNLGKAAKKPVEYEPFGDEEVICEL